MGVLSVVVCHYTVLNKNDSSIKPEPNSHHIIDEWQKFIKFSPLRVTVLLLAVELPSGVLRG